MAIGAGTVHLYHLQVGAPHNRIGCVPRNLHNVRRSPQGVSLFSLRFAPHVPAAGQHVVLPNRWQPAYGGKRTAGVDAILLPDVPVHTPHGAVGQDNSKGGHETSGLVPVSEAFRS